MAPIDTDYFAKLGRWDQLNQAAESQVGQDPNLSQRLGAYSNHFPWMDPSAMWSLAKAGIDPLHPAAQAAAASAAQLKVATGAGYGTVNGSQTPPSQSDIPNVLNGLTGINDDLDRVKQAQNASTPPPMAYAAPPQSQIQQLMGRRSGVKGLGLQKTSWDLLPQDVRDQLRQVSITPASASDLPVQQPSTDPNLPTGVAHPVYNVTDDSHEVFRLGGTENLSPDAASVLNRVIDNAAGGGDAAIVKTGPLSGASGLAGTGGNFIAIEKRPLPRAFIEGPGNAGPIGGGTDPISTLSASALPNGGASTGLNAFIRTSGMVMGAPLQEVQGQIRNAYQLGVNQERPNIFQSQSDLGIALGDIAQGKKADTGEGFFVDPNSGVAQERERRALERGNIYGHAVTLGRAAGAAVNEGVADVTGYHVMEPGSLQYNLLSGVVDATVALKLDPTAKAFGYLGEVNQARGTIREAGSVAKAVEAVKEGEGASGALTAFQQAGGINGIRRSVSNDAKDVFLSSPKGSKYASDVAAIDDPYTIWDSAKDRRGFPQMMPQTAHALAGTTDAGNVSLYLRDQLGPVIKDVPSFSRGTERSVASTVLGDSMATDGAPIVLATTPNRWTSMMPSGALLDTNDLQNAAIQLERGASLMETPDDVFRNAFKTLAGATGPKDVDNAFQTILKDASDRLTTKFMKRIKVPDPRDEADVARYNLDVAEAKKNARSIAMMRDNPVGPDGVYAAHAVGTGQGQMGQQLVVDGVPVVVTDNKPIILGQTLGGKIPMPNWRKLRTNLSDADRILTNPVVNAADHLANGAQSVWKGVQIMTIKTMVKVLADEQAAIAGRGYDSFINHPLQAMGVIMATPLAELPTDAGLFTRIRHAEVRGFRWAAEKVPGVDEHLTTMPFDESFAHVDKMKIASTGGWDKFMDTRGAVHADNWQAMPRRPGENDLEFLNAHARNLAQYAGSEDARGFARAESLQAAKDSYWDGPLKNARLDFARQENLPEIGAEATDRAASDAHVEHVMEQMQYVTNQNPKLMDAIRTGRLEGTPMFKPRADGSAGLARGYVQRLTNFSDDFPQVTIAQKAVNVGDPKRQVLDAMFGRAINMLLSTPSAVLSKSPLFRQAYWQHLIDNSTYMSDEARASFMDAAHDTNLTNTLQKRLDSTTARIARSTATSPGTLSFEDADNLAKSYALQIVQRTTHDFTDRSQFFDAIRVLTPFGDVWRKTLQRWGNIIAENPAVVRRGQQGFEQARSTGMGETFGQPAGQGFFHCVDKTTEALTHRGWMRYDEIQPTDLFLSINPDTDEITWERGTVNTFDFDGYLTRWDSKAIDALTTDSHRWIVESWGKGTRSFKRSHEVSRNHRLVLGGGTPNGFASTPLHEDELVELIGWAITEGYYTKRPHKNDTSVRIYQDERANPEKVHRIRLLAKYYRGLGATASENTTRETYKMFFFGKGIGSTVRALAPDKQLTPNFLRSLTEEQANLLLDTLIAGDGWHRYSPSGKRHRSFGQSDLGRVAGFQMLCSMLGYRTRARELVRADSGPREIRGVPMETRQRHYTISLYSQRHGAILPERVRQERYAGVVWCPSLRTGTWMARRNGSTYWTGNTDSFGQEVFTIPGTEFANQAITGVPVPLTGNVQGLSMGTEFFPALGPVASLPVAWTMEKLHLMNVQTPLGRIGDVLFPYGPPKTDVGSILDGWNYAPTWMKTAFGKDRQTSPDDVRVYNNAIKGVIAYGVSNGDYDMTTTEGVAHAVEDASSKTATLFHIRGAAQFFIPGAPAPEMLVKDKGGKLLDLDALIGDYSKLQDQQNKGLIPDAQGAFLDKYGPDLFRAITPKSYASVFGIPTSHDSAQWVNDHPSLRTDFPHIYGYFAPPSDSKDFDYDTYLEQFNRGERVALTPEQWAKLSNARLAGLQYGRAKDKVNEVSGGKPTDAQKAWLATVKQNLINEYPGYEDALYGGSGLPGRPQAKLLVDEAKKAINDPIVQGTDAGKATKTYMDQRDKVDQAWIASGYKTGSWGQSTSGYAVQIRAYLRKLGSELVKGHPQFSGIFDGVLDREMRDDALPVQGAGG